MKNKKAQEEIVGFVAIVVFVAIILVVFLGLYVRQEKTSSIQESKDIQQFLDSSMQYTTDCALAYEPAYAELSELIQACHNGLSRCISGEDPCNLSTKTLSNLIEAGFLINEQASIKAYEFKSIYTTNTTEKEIISLKKGNCTQTIKGAENLIPAFPGTISNTLKLCY